MNSLTALIYNSAAHHGVEASLVIGLALYGLLDLAW